MIERSGAPSGPDPAPTDPVSPTDPVRGIEAVRDQAVEIARGWARPGAPPSWRLTATLFRCLAEDEALAALAAKIPLARLPALLFAAAACHLVGQHRPPGLVDYFPAPGATPRPPDRRFRPALVSFCLDHASEMLDLFAHRRYQMNEVARSTQVALALDALELGDRPAGVAFIDLGAGAGLALHLDRYGHRLSNGAWLGDRMSPLVLRSEIGGPAPTHPSLPVVGRRMGVDLDPIDLHDATSRAWARSCIPPEVDSLARFDGACELARAHPGPVRRGDALEALPAMLDEVPADLLPVVVDTYAAVFFSDEQRSRLRALLRRRGRTRRLAWISLDPLVPLGTAGRDSVQGLPVPPRLVDASRREGVFALLGLMEFDRGGETGRLLARAHPSGTSAVWLEDAGVKP